MANNFRTDEERTVTLTPKEQQNILNLDPNFDSIIETVYFDNYDLPCPIRIKLQTKSSKDETLVLRKTRHGSVQNEVKILQILKEFGLPVADVLLPPFQNEHGEFAAVYSLLPGENLQKLSMRGEPYLTQAKDLLIQAVLKLKEVTSFVSNSEVSEIIPEQTLANELESVKGSNNPWLNEEVFQNAIKKLEGYIKNIHTPLILSNGDYQPGNFLAEDGKLTGFLDFESVSFQDPLMGFVKYPIYDLRPLSRTNLIESFLDKSGFSKEDFHTRLALGCLKILCKEIPISDSNTETVEYRDKVLNLLRTSL